MKRFYFTMLLFLCCLTAKPQQATLMPGTIAPLINLVNVNDKMVSLRDYPAAKGFIVVFTCNTCPYAKAYEQRIAALDTQFSPLNFPVIAINPNDPSVSPGDALDKMKTLAKAHNYTFPYLFDEGQQITKAYGAKNTPHVFILAKKADGFIVEYAGAIDNDTPDTNPAKIKYVENAVNALLQNTKPAVTFTKAIGCGVKWKKAG